MKFTQYIIGQPFPMSCNGFIAKKKKKIEGTELGFLACCILYCAILICFPDFESQIFACTIPVISLTSQFYSFIQHIDAVNVGLKI